MDSLLLRPDGLDYKFAIQLFIAGCHHSAEEVGNFIDQHFWGNSLVVEGDKELLKISIHTNKPWEILEYCAGIGDIFDITMENRTRK